VAHVLRQVLGALAEAHGIGLMHRDVKPGDVILCERGGLPDVAKVVDFGLVKDLEDDGGLSHEPPSSARHTTSPLKRSAHRARTSARISTPSGRSRTSC
jgi:serine/threonine protein kinase